MKENKTIFETKWVKVRQTEKGFQYLERRGKDSVAVLCTRYDENGDVEYLVRYQPLCVNGDDRELFECPITGSMDHDGEEPVDVAIREVFEEAGYVVTKDNMTSIGSYIVGTQTNEVVHCFFAWVGDDKPVKPEGDGGFHESISYNQWRGFDDLRKYQYGAFGFFLKHI